MTEDRRRRTAPELHRELAVEANAATWELLGQPDAAEAAIPPADVADLLERAYAAAYHWRRAAGRTPANDARAAWLLSRCHVVARHADLALHYAETTGEIVADAGLADFDLAYAREAQARALALMGIDEVARDLRDEAGAVPIADPQDREIFTADLESGPWFGLADD